MKNQPTSTCSAVSEDSLLPLDGLDLKPLDSATTNLTPKPSSKSIGRMCQSTETSKLSTARHIEESLFSQEDFPASRSVVPGSNEARTMTAISGRKCSESYKRQSQLGSLVRMLLESSAWHSTKCVLTWKSVDTKSSRSLFQLAVSMPRTEEIESGSSHIFWATPNTMDHLPSRPAKDCSTNQKNRKNRTRSGNLREQVVHPKMWPTPSVCGNYNRKGASKNSGNGLATAVLFWPTPQAHDAKHIYSKMKPTGQQMLSNHIYKIDSTTIGGKLNPAFVEWLMGYSIGHTDLKGWATPSSRKSHTKSSKA